MNNDSELQELRARRMAEFRAHAAAAAIPPSKGLKKIFDSARGKSNLGKGTFGRVVSVEFNGQPCALKRVIFNESENKGNHIHASSEEMFLNEVALLTKLMGNPQVVQMIDYEHTPGKDGYVLMEKLQGTELSNAHETLETYNESRFKALLISLLKGIESIHNAGVMHLDIKPENLWLTYDHKIKFFDFNVGCTAPCTRKGRVGTARYMKPMNVDEVPNFENDYHSIHVLCSDFATYNKYTERLQTIIDDLQYAVEPYDLDVIIKNLENLRIGGGRKSRRRSSVRVLSRTFRHRAVRK